MTSTRYIVIFILILTSVVAISLTGLREATKEKAAQNELIFNKRAILSAVNDYLPNGQSVSDLSDNDVVELFNQQVEQRVLDMNGQVVEGMLAENVDMAQEQKKPEAQRLLPLYIYNTGDEKFYIVSVRGSGLWDAIWGNIALRDDLNTVAGAAFDHAGETPGLGAEIKDNPNFSEQFKGKEIYEDGTYVSVEVRKGDVDNTVHDVDGISGATVTCVGVSEMLYRGIRYYEPYFESVRQQSLIIR